MDMISVIVPIYNREFSLEYCLTSIRKQTFSQWECILVDDGSTDSSLFICRQFAQQDARFRVFSQTNQGVSMARNCGISESHGDYLAFIDSDDWIDPMYLQKLYDMLGRCDMPMCGTQLTDQAGEKLRSHFEQDAVCMLDNNAVELLSRIVENGLIFNPAYKLFSRAIIDKNQLSFKKGLQWGEDAVFACEYLQYCRSIGFTSELLHHAVKHPDSLSAKARYDLSFFESGLLVWESLHSLYLSHRINNDKAIEFIDRYYSVILENGVGCVQYWHDKLTAKERLVYIGNVLLKADSERLWNSLRRNPRQLKIWLIYLKQKLGLWVSYELIFYWGKWRK